MQPRVTVHDAATRLEGPLLFMRRTLDVGLNEAVVASGRDGTPRLGRIAALDETSVTIEMLEPTGGLGLAATVVRFLGEPIDFGVGPGVLGRVFVCITNIVIDPQAGVVSTGRVFSGTLRKGQDFHLVNANKDLKDQQVSIYMGQYREIVDEIPAGNIIALLGIGEGRSGETIVDASIKNGAIGFESIKYASDPVLTIAVEPKKPTDLPRLIDAMQKMSIQDPNLVTTINQETGEYLLAGMGELHLEIALKDLKREYNLDVTERERSRSCFYSSSATSVRPPSSSPSLRS